MWNSIVCLPIYSGFLSHTSDTGWRGWTSSAVGGWYIMYLSGCLAYYRHCSKFHMLTASDRALKAGVGYFRGIRI